MQVLQDAVYYILDVYIAGTHHHAPCFDFGRCKNIPHFIIKFEGFFIGQVRLLSNKLRVFVSGIYDALGQP